MTSRFKTVIKFMEFCHPTRQFLGENHSDQKEKQETQMQKNMLKLLRFQLFKVFQYLKMAFFFAQYADVSCRGQVYSRKDVQQPNSQIHDWAIKSTLAQGFCTGTTGYTVGGAVRQPYTRVDFIPSQGSMNSATYLNPNNNNSFINIPANTNINAIRSLSFDIVSEERNVPFSFF